MHEPFTNDNFGSPTAVAQSLWAGIMTWRCWRKYIELNSATTLIDNFISRSHYLTLELMAHTGILHQLALHLSFPNLSIKEYSMRSTGNRGIEAIHSVLCGASPNLPITSGNLTFQDFLSRMNKVVHMKSAEHALRQIPGNTVTYTKKKKITYAAKCLEQPSQLQDTYQ